ncbi:LysR family transcriptional regulator [Sphingobacterium lactis]|uniref:LysR family transcriptional regulator n=1 Tax=Sphingobacterium lactis TaxID=797291 RepID=UPI003F7E0453
MELRHIQYFQVLAEELHFGNAAKRLFISQPPLSRQIKELELELGVSLFNRTNKKVALTDAGRYLYTQTASLLQQLAQVKNNTKLIHDQLSGEIKLGFISSTSKILIARILEELKTSYPALQINLFEASSIKQLSAIQEGKLDLAIIRTDNIPSGINQTLLYQEELCLVGPAGIRNWNESMKQLNFISFNPQYAPQYYQETLDYCQQLGIEPSFRHQCNNMNAILELVSLGLGLAIAPKSMCINRKDLSLFSPSRKNLQMFSKVYLCYSADLQNSHLTTLIKQITRTANQLL